MDTQNNVFGWVVGVIIVILIVAGIWWWASSNPASTSETATSTPQTTTTTTNNTPAVSVQAATGSTVDQVVAGLAGAKRFASLYASTGVAASVTGKGPYTVFVPTDAAMAAANLSGMTSAQLKLMVQNHIVSGKMLDLDAVSSGTYPALSKQTLNFQVQPQTKIAYVGSGYAVAQYKASNGIVYVITAVLLPTQVPNPSTGATGSPVPTQ